MKTLDETGLEVAGCRHGLALQALNMFRGEIYVSNKFIMVTYYIGNTF